MKLSTYLTTHSFFESQTLKNKKPLKKRGFKGGPTWARTRDQLIMSQLRLRHATLTNQQTLRYLAKT
jgi:hypothetical protein